MSTSLMYRREIDGLRAVAVVPVILFHAGFGVFSGGFVGVDVFFVISGYLITTILINELEQGNFSIAGFYERRARRILPALFVVMLACLPFAYMWMLPSQLKGFAQSLVAVVTFSSNILFWREDGYFAAAAELKPLLHTWSLAVEEQYYLLFPIFLLLAWRFGRKRVFWTVVVIAAVSLLMAEWGWRNNPSANFYLAPTRAWELFAGSICAFLTVGRSQRSSNGLSVIGLAMIVFSIFAYDADTPFPSVYALVPVVGTALIILFAAQGTWVARLLSMRAFVGIGLISYSAYLWHQPLFAFARLRSLTEPSEYLMAALAVAAVLLAWATWSFVEQPFRKSKKSLIVTRRGVFLSSGAMGALLVVFGLAGHFSKGFEWRFAEEIASVDNFIQDRQPYDICHIMSVNQPAVFPNPSCASNEGDKFDVLLFGDSHSNAISGVMLNDLKELGTSSYQTSYTTCLPLPNFEYNGSFIGSRCSDFSNLVYEFSGNANVQVLVLTARWPLYVHGLGFDNGEGGIETKSTNYCYQIDQNSESECGNEAVILDGIERELRLLSERFRIVLVYPIPEAGWDVGNKVLKSIIFNDQDVEIDTSYAAYKERAGGIIAVFDQLVGEVSNIYGARVDKALCSNTTGRCVNSDASGVYYYDDDHLTNAGAHLLSPIIIESIQEALGNDE